MQIASVIVLREDSVALRYRRYLPEMSGSMVLNEAQVSFDSWSASMLLSLL